LSCAYPQLSGECFTIVKAQPDKAEEEDSLLWLVNIHEAIITAGCKNTKSLIEAMLQLNHMRGRINFSRIAFWLGLGMVIYIFFMLIGEGGKSYRLRNQADKINVEISQLQEQTELLEYKIAYYTTDVYKERLAREKLGLQYAGESVVIVRGSKPERTKSSLQLNQTEEALPASNFQAWLEFLFGNKR
jgi:hypothetical protein